MQTRRVIEIVKSGGHLPAELILTGYWASQSGLIVFILNGVTPQAVNLVLDPIVVTLPLTIPGVLYVDVRDKARVREAVLFAEEIYAATRFFRRLTVRCGIAPRLIAPVERAIPMLESRTLSERDARTPDVAKPQVTTPVPTGHRLGWGAADAARRAPIRLQTFDNSI
ncbi:hypothetical protein [Sinorhizobium meliloti]|uniref:Uncharacterized protein n=1 Tax=Rhizobium meliloti TaxID=382 RepID=A0A2J0Z1H2_RHIML|nr:hypothetical protein CEJ86_15040 [Sinorhizobium meliloti]